MLSIAKYRLATARYTEALAVTVSAPGFTLETLEQQVTHQLEGALGQVNGVESLRSTTTGDLVVVEVSVSAVGIEAPSPTTLVQQAVQGSLSSLPREIDAPLVQRVEPNTPTLHFLARTETLTRAQLSRWLDEEARLQLLTQNGVREVRLCGAVRTELQIELDQPRLRALGLSATEVADAIEHGALDLPSGRLQDQGTTLTVRGADRSLESLENLALKGGVKLREVATLTLGSEQGRCTTASDVLVSVRTMPGVELKLPEHPAVKLTPFVPVRTATFAAAPGTSVEQSLLALSRAAPGAMITHEGGELTLMLPENRPLPQPPGFALRSVDEPRTIVRVSGPDFERLREVGEQARALLVKEAAAKWVGTPWPQLAPEKVIIAEPGAKGARDIARTLQLAITGVEAGELSDGTGIRVRAGRSLEEAVLPDGRPVTGVVQVRLEEKPAAMLHVNRQRAVELEIGLGLKEVRRALGELQLPAGMLVTFEEREIERTSP